MGSITNKDSTSFFLPPFFSILPASVFGFPSLQHLKCNRKSYHIFPVTLVLFYGWSPFHHFQLFSLSIQSFFAPTSNFQPLVCNTPSFTHDACNRGMTDTERATLKDFYFSNILGDFFIVPWWCMCFFQGMLDPEHKHKESQRKTGTPISCSRCKFKIKLLMM